MPLLESKRTLTPVRSAARPSLRPWPPAPSGSWRYDGLPRLRWVRPLAAFVAASFLATLIFGTGRHRKVVQRPAEENLLLVTMAIPALKDLEEPDPAPRDPDEPPLTPAEYAPTLVDAPRLALPTDFVQQLDYASLIQPLDLSDMKVFTIPPHILHGTGTGSGITDILNLADLDHIPEPISQPAPMFPPALLREVDLARVTVEFIVTKEGRVVDPIVIESTHSGFDTAAATGVGRWRFRPGIKGGRNVNTRMRVPITFRKRVDE